MPYNLHPFNKTMANKMTAKKLMTAVCVAALCGGVWAADEAKPVPTSTANAEKEVEVEEKDDSPLVAVEAGLAFDSRFMTYNVSDGWIRSLGPAAGLPSSIGCTSMWRRSLT